MGEISVLRTRAHTRPVLRTILSLALGGLVLLPAAAPAYAAVVANDDSVSSPAAEDVVVDVLDNDTGLTGDEYVTVPDTTVNGAYLYVDDAHRVHFYADTEGADSFTYTVLDNTTGDPVGTASVAITVTPALVVSARDDEYDAEKDFATVLPVTDNDTTGAGTVGLDPSGEPSHGTITFNPDDYQPTITYTPTAGYEGVDTFGYKLVGDGGDMDTATVTVHVKQVGVQRLDIARAWTGAHLTWQNPRSPSFTGLVARIATVADDGVDHTPQTPSDGDPVALADSATRLDLTGLSRPLTYVVSIFAHYQDGSYSEPVSREFSPGIEPVRNLHVDAGNAQVTLAWTNPEGSDTTKVEYDTPTGVHKTVSASTGTATKTITSLTNGRDYTFTVTSLADGSGPAYVGDPLAIDARPRSRTNHPPVATDDVVSLVGSDPAQVDLLGNDQDADNDDLTVLSTTQPGSGAVSCDSYGTCTYTPADSDPQSATFTYVVTDSHGGRDTGTVDLRQRHLVAQEDSGTATTAEVSRFDVLANDTGSLPEDTLEVEPIDPAVGTVEVTSDADDHQFVLFVPASLAAPAGNRAGLTAAAVRPALVGPSGTRVEVAYRVVDDRGHELGTSVLHLLVRPAPEVTLAADHPTSAAGAPVTLSGTATRVAAGTPVYLDRLAADGSWTQLAEQDFATTAGSDAASGAPYSFTVSPASSGRPAYRVRIPQNPSYAESDQYLEPLEIYTASLGTMRRTTNEYVTVKNNGKVPFSLGSWTITTKAGKKLTLPAKVLNPAKSVRVHPGSGRTTSTDLYLRRGSSFGNTHDRLRLRDGHGWLMFTKTY